jgi:uncharacterized protein YcfL
MCFSYNTTTSLTKQEVVINTKPAATIKWKEPFLVLVVTQPVA